MEERWLSANFFTESSMVKESRPLVLHVIWNAHTAFLLYGTDLCSHNTNTDVILYAFHNSCSHSQTFSHRFSTKYCHAAAYNTLFKKCRLMKYGYNSRYQISRLNPQQNKQYTMCLSCNRFWQTFKQNLTTSQDTKTMSRKLPVCCPSSQPVQLDSKFDRGSSIPPSDNHFLQRWKAKLFDILTSLITTKKSVCIT